jgi:hypothetical protein
MFITQAAINFFHIPKEHEHYFGFILAIIPFLNMVRELRYVKSAEQGAAANP